MLLIEESGRSSGEDSGFTYCMPIVGLTDRTNFNSLGRLEIGVFKGERKSGNSPGRDLESKLRITTANNTVKSALTNSKKYGTANLAGDFLTESINIYLAHDELERTFPTSMQMHSGSGLEIECDRHTIYKKCVPTKDEKGNIWRPIHEVNEVCPMRDKGFVGKCPNECVQQGQLLFYIKEVLDSDIMIPARLTVHGYEDITYLDATLNQLAKFFGAIKGQELGSLTISPFPCAQFRHHIPLVLSRTSVEGKRPVTDKDGLRTGKKAKKINWVMSLSVHPDWMHLYRNWQMIKEMENRGLQPAQSAIAGLLRGDNDVIIDVESTVIQVPVLPPASQAIDKITRMRKRLQDLVNERESLTGEQYTLKIENMNEAELVAEGTKIRKELDAIRQAV